MYILLHLHTATINTASVVEAIEVHWYDYHSRFPYLLGFKKVFFVVFVFTLPLGKVAQTQVNLVTRDSIRNIILYIHKPSTTKMHMQ